MSNSYFTNAGRIWKNIDKKNVVLHEQLPVGTYLIGVSQEGLYFQEVDDFHHKGKIYGDHQKNVDRILNTYNSRTVNTGVLLEGEKGSGKTLLAKLLAEEGHKQGVTTFIINKPLAGDSFSNLVNALTQPSIFIFDEFEKVYDAETQEQLLTLFDGVFTSKKLFVITVNDKYRVDKHMHNRPGRLFYALSYKGLDEAFIREYSADNLKTTLHHHIDKIVSASQMFTSFNFDMLKALVEDMNRYDESPAETLVILNAKPESKGEMTYNLHATYLDNGEALVVDDDKNNWVNHYNPIHGRAGTYVFKTLEDYKNCENDDDDFDDNNREYLVVDPDHLTLVKGGEFVYRMKAFGRDVKIVSKKKEYKPTHYTEWLGD